MMRCKQCKSKSKPKNLHKCSFCESPYHVQCLINCFKKVTSESNAASTNLSTVTFYCSECIDLLKDMQTKHDNLSAVTNTFIEDQKKAMENMNNQQEATKVALAKANDKATELEGKWNISRIFLVDAQKTIESLEAQLQNYKLQEDFKLQEAELQDNELQEGVNQEDKIQEDEIQEDKGQMDECQEEELQEIKCQAKTSTTILQACPNPDGRLEGQSSTLKIDNRFLQKSKQQNFSNDPDSFDTDFLIKIVKEDRKRFSRCLNICIRGLPYSGDDEKSFLSLCQFQLNLDPDLVANSIVSLNRVGNTGCLKPRVLIIKLNCRNTRKTILRNSYKLKNFISSAGTNVFVSPDFTRAQLLINSRNKQRRCSRAKTFMTQHSCESQQSQEIILSHDRVA